MNEMEIRKNLYNKLEKEFKDFIEEMKTNRLYKASDTDVYPIVMKEELLSMFYPESERFDIEEIKALNKIDSPLEELYQGWMDTDEGIHSVLEDSVSNTLEEVLKEQKEKKKDRER